jgi:hypothetical protein
MFLICLSSKSEIPSAEIFLTGGRHRKFFVDVRFYCETVCRVNSTGNIAPCTEDIAQAFQGQGKVAFFLLV